MRELHASPGFALYQRKNTSNRFFIQLELSREHDGLLALAPFPNLSAGVETQLLAVESARKFTLHQPVYKSFAKR